MRAMVQQDADALGLGVEVVAFTVGGMHPPVPVAAAYEAVVSAELGKVTAVVNAQVFRNQTVPAAEASVLKGVNAARAEGRGSPGKGGGRGVELPHAGVAVSRRRRKNIFSAAAWRRWKKACRAHASRWWIPASSGMEVNCG